MGVSTVTAGRIFSVGVDGQLVLDQFPHTALSRTYSADSITPDSAPMMTAMMTGVNTNQSVIGFGERTEANDFNNDGDGKAPWDTPRVGEASGHEGRRSFDGNYYARDPAATYSHINQRNYESDIALQACQRMPDTVDRVETGLVPYIVVPGRSKLIAQVATICSSTITPPITLPMPTAPWSTCKH